MNSRKDLKIGGLFLTLALIIFPLGVSAQNADVERGKGEQEEVSKDEDSFGQYVSEEAQKLKDADLETKKNFGRQISNKVRKDKKHRPEASYNSQGAGAADGVRENLPEAASSGGDSGSQKGPGL